MEPLYIYWYLPPSGYYQIIIPQMRRINRSMSGELVAYWFEHGTWRESQHGFLTCYYDYYLYYN